jgi:hypothetical protein
MENFVLKDKTGIMNKSERIVWGVNHDNCIQLFKTRFEVSINYKEGLVVTGLIDYVEKLSFRNTDYPQDKVFILLANDNGLLIYCSNNFRVKYLKNEEE